MNKGVWDILQLKNDNIDDFVPIEYRFNAFLFFSRNFKK